MGEKGGYGGIEVRETMGKDGVMNPRKEEEGSQGWKGRGSQLGKSLGLKRADQSGKCDGPGELGTSISRPRDLCPSLLTYGRPQVYTQLLTTDG